MEFVKKKVILKSAEYMLNKHIYYIVTNEFNLSCRFILFDSRTGQPSLFRDNSEDVYTYYLCTLVLTWNARADKMSQAWINFARYGDPNHAGLPKWEPYTEENGTTMFFDNECVIKHHHDRELLKVTASVNNWYIQ